MSSEKNIIRISDFEFMENDKRVKEFIEKEQKQYISEETDKEKIKSYEKQLEVINEKIEKELKDSGYYNLSSEDKEDKEDKEESDLLLLEDDEDDEDEEKKITKKRKRVKESSSIQEQKYINEDEIKEKIIKKYKKQIEEIEKKKYKISDEDSKKITEKVNKEFPYWKYRLLAPDATIPGGIKASVNDIRTLLNTAKKPVYDEKSRNPFYSAKNEYRSVSNFIYANLIPEKFRSAHSSLRKDKSTFLRKNFLKVYYTSLYEFYTEELTKSFTFLSENSETFKKQLLESPRVIVQDLDSFYSYIGEDCVPEKEKEEYKLIFDNTIGKVLTTLRKVLLKKNREEQENERTKNAYIAYMILLEIGKKSDSFNYFVLLNMPTYQFIHTFKNLLPVGINITNENIKHVLSSLYRSTSELKELVEDEISKPNTIIRKFLTKHILSIRNRIEKIKEECIEELYIRHIKAEFEGYPGFFDFSEPSVDLLIHQLFSEEDNYLEEIKPRIISDYKNGLLDKRFNKEIEKRKFSVITDELINSFKSSLEPKNQEEMKEMKEMKEIIKCNSKTFKTSKNIQFCKKPSYEIDENKQKELEKIIFVKDDTTTIFKELSIGKTKIIESSVLLPREEKLNIIEEEEDFSPPFPNSSVNLQDNNSHIFPNLQKEEDEEDEEDDFSPPFPNSSVNLQDNNSPIFPNSKKEEETISFKIGDIQYVLDIKKNIGKGTNGEIYLLYDDKNKVHFALKKENGIMSEKDISNALNESSCNTLKVKYLSSKKEGGEENHYYLMEVAQGDLHNFKEILNQSDLSQEEKVSLTINILEEIRRQLECIMDVGYVYTDYKLTNILYRCDDLNDLSKIKIYIGDLGSAVPSPYYISTYPPFEKINKVINGYFLINKDDAEDKNNVLSWGLGILLLSFIDYDKLFNFQYNTINEDLKDDFFKEIMEDINKYYGKDFGSYLSKNPSSRPNIRTPLIKPSEPSEPSEPSYEPSRYMFELNALLEGRDMLVIDGLNFKTIGHYIFFKLFKLIPQLDNEKLIYQIIQGEPRLYIIREIFMKQYNDNLHYTIKQLLHYGYEIKFKMDESARNLMVKLPSNTSFIFNSKDFMLGLCKKEKTFRGFRGLNLVGQTLDYYVKELKSQFEYSKDIKESKIVYKTMNLITQQDIYKDWFKMRMNDMTRTIFYICQFQLDFKKPLNKPITIEITEEMLKSIVLKFYKPCFNLLKKYRLVEISDISQSFKESIEKSAKEPWSTRNVNISFDENALKYLWVYFSTITYQLSFMVSQLGDLVDKDNKEELTEILSIILGTSLDYYNDVTRNKSKKSCEIQSYKKPISDCIVRTLLNISKTILDIKNSLYKDELTQTSELNLQILQNATDILIPKSIDKKKHFNLIEKTKNHDIDSDSKKDILSLIKERFTIRKQSEDEVLDWFQKISKFYKSCQASEQQHGIYFNTRLYYFMNLVESKDDDKDDKDDKEYKDEENNLNKLYEKLLNKHYTEEDTNLEPEENKKTKSLQLQTVPSSSTERKGISNVGNSCYMNAILQLLYSIDELRTTILTVDIPPLTQDTSMLQRSGNPVSRTMNLGGYKNVLLALRTIFTNLSESSKKSIPNAVYDILRKVNPDFGNKTQEDSAELFRGILPIIRSFYTDPKILRTLFAMSYYETSAVTCANGSTSITNELIENSTYENLSTFMKIVDRDSVSAKSIPDKQFPIILNNAVKFSLDLNIVDESKKPLESVQAAINEYTKVENIKEDDNKVAVCTDKGSVARTKQLSIHSSLYTKWYIITLKRFEHELDSKGGFITDSEGNIVFTKNSKPITITPIIDIDGNRFEIQGLILHIGRTTRSGHYIYIVYEGGNPSRVLNDNENIPITREYNSMIPTNSYILLYKKIRV